MRVLVPGWCLGPRESGPLLQSLPGTEQLRLLSEAKLLTHCSCPLSPLSAFSCQAKQNFLFPCPLARPILFLLAVQRIQTGLGTGGVAG